MSAEPLAQPEAVVYCRVSSKGQEQDGTSLDSHERLAVEHAERLGYRVRAVVREVYSGAELYDRLKLAEVRRDVAAGRYGALVAYSTDRLSRDPIHLSILAEECTRAECALLFVQDVLDDSDEGRLLAYVKGYSSKKEREKIRERSLRGKHTRALQGKVTNMGPERYGWRRDREAGVRLLYEPEAATVRRIFGLVGDERQSYHAVARTLNAEGVQAPGGPGVAWTANTIMRIIRDTAYKGEAVAWRYKQMPPPSRQQQEREKTAGARRCISYRLVERSADEQVRLPAATVPAIVSADLWERAQHAVRAQQGDRTRNEKAEYLLRGLLTCPRCGRRLYPSWQTRNGTNKDAAKKRTYRCGSYTRPGARCACNQANAGKLEAWVWDRVSYVLRHPEVIAAELQREQEAGPDPQLAADLETARREVARCERKQGELMQRYDPDNAAFPWELVEREVARLHAERQRWQDQATDIQRRLDQYRRVVGDLEALNAYCAQVADKLDGADFAHQRLALEALEVRVTADGQEWTIDGRVPLAGLSGDVVSPISPDWPHNNMAGVAFHFTCGPAQRVAARRSGEGAGSQATA